MRPRLIEGGVHRDQRGEVRHINAFTFDHVDRCYVVRPARTGEVRGWVGHRRDWKFFLALEGEFRIGVVIPTDWTAPARDLRPDVFRLVAECPAILEVPPGCYAASVAVRPSSALMIFSSGGIHEAASDDFRLPPDYWPLELAAEGPGTAP